MRLYLEAFELDRHLVLGQGCCHPGNSFCIAQQKEISHKDLEKKETVEKSTLLGEVVQRQLDQQVYWNCSQGWKQRGRQEILRQQSGKEAKEKRKIPNFCYNCEAMSKGGSSRAAGRKAGSLQETGSQGSSSQRLKIPNFAYNK